MHILIDVQGCQSGSKYRGIGRSTLGISRAIIKNAGNHRVSLLINGMYPLDNIIDVKSNFRDILPEKEMFIFSAVSPTAYQEIKNHSRTHAALLCREAAIANINPDIVLITSFFEGFSDNFVISIPSESTPWRTVCVCHDLIPLLHKEEYFVDPVYHEFYMNKLHEYEKTDAIFAVSNSCAQEVLKNTNISSERIFNISSAAANEFCVNKYDNDDIMNIRRNYNLPLEFILTQGVTELRKNIRGLLHAYSLLSKELQEKYPLVLVYKINDEERVKFIKMAEGYGVKSKQLFFTGHVPDADLIALYNLCKLFVYPSLHEGFGLPPLEAMKCGAATLASNVTSLPEVIGWDEAMFDPYNPNHISATIERALTDDSFYQQLKVHALSQAQRFSWDKTAEMALEIFMKIQYTRKEQNPEYYLQKFITRIAEDHRLTIEDKLGTAWALARNNFSKHTKKILVDISVLVQHDARTGIQRVSRNILNELLKNKELEYDIRAVYFTEGQCYRYANQYIKTNFGYDFGYDTPVLFTKDDILLVTDLTAHLFPELVFHLDIIRRSGAKACFVVHDILALLNPEWCSEGIQRTIPVWLKGIMEHADCIVCVSASVANDVRHWLSEHDKELKTNPVLTIKNFHLGADLESSAPTTGLPKNITELLDRLLYSQNFLMVGTIEPRKGHAQVLGAFERLWDQGENIKLVIVGKKGWNVDSLVKRLYKHPQYNKHLLWLENISDEFLLKLYLHANALIFASLGEGFGLPLIEAARHGLPLIIRDIPVFREIAQDNAFYFKGEQNEDIEVALLEWMKLYKTGTHPKSEKIKWLNWKQSTDLLLKQLPLISDYSENY